MIIKFRDGSAVSSDRLGSLRPLNDSQFGPRIVVELKGGRDHPNTYVVDYDSAESMRAELKRVTDE